MAHVGDPEVHVAALVAVREARRRGGRGVRCVALDEPQEVQEVPSPSTLSSSAAAVKSGSASRLCSDRPARFHRMDRSSAFRAWRAPAVRRLRK
jgi:hypothetical protein